MLLFLAVKDNKVSHIRLIQAKSATNPSLTVNYWAPSLIIEALFKAIKPLSPVMMAR